MARDVIGHLAKRLREFLLQEAIAVAQHEIFEGVDHRVGDCPDIRVVGKNQWQFGFVHQRAGRHRRHDREAILGIGREDRNVDVLQLFDALEVAELELRHAATRLFLDDSVRNLIMREHLQQVAADSGFIVVDVAGREDRDLAGRSRAVPDRPGKRRRSRRAKSR